MRMLAAIAAIALAAGAVWAGDYNSRALSVSGVTTSTTAVTASDTKTVEGVVKYIDLVTKVGTTSTVQVVALSNDLSQATTLLSLTVGGGTNRYYVAHLVESTDGTDATDAWAPYCVVKQTLQLSAHTLTQTNNSPGSAAVKIVYEGD